MRCYDGAPDSELQALLDGKDRCHKRLAKAGLKATYFPMEGKWMVFKGHHAVTVFHTDLFSATHAAMKETDR